MLRTQSVPYEPPPRARLYDNSRYACAASKDSYGATYVNIPSYRTHDRYHPETRMGDIKTRCKQLYGRNIGVAVVFALGTIILMTILMAVCERRPSSIGRLFLHDRNAITDQVLTMGGVRVRLFLPPEVLKPSPGIVYIHGDDWTASLDEKYVNIFRWLVKSTGYPLLAITHRTPPTFTFPTPFDDCFHAVHDFLQTAHRYGIDRSRLVLAGDGAGGTLAAAVTLKLRDLDIEPKIKQLVLFNAYLQAFDFLLPSYLEDDRDISKSAIIDHWLLYSLGKLQPAPYVFYNRHVSASDKYQYSHLVNISMATNNITVSERSISMRYREAYWLKSDPEAKRLLKPYIFHPYFAPGMAANLTDFPRAVMYLGTQNPVRDENVIFAQRLIECGTKVMIRIYRHANKEGLCCSTQGLDLRISVANDIKANV